MCLLNELKNLLAPPRNQELTGCHKTLSPVSSYPAFCFDWFDEWGAAHGLGLYHVIIEEQLNVINCTQDVCILQINTPHPIRITIPTFHADTQRQ